MLGRRSKRMSLMYWWGLVSRALALEKWGQANRVRVSHVWWEDDGGVDAVVLKVDTN